jgi:hypothetical protein
MPARYGERGKQPVHAYAADVHRAAMRLEVYRPNYLGHFHLLIFKGFAP